MRRLINFTKIGALALGLSFTTGNLVAQNDGTNDDFELSGLQGIFPNSYMNMNTGPQFNGFVGITTHTPLRNLHITGVNDPMNESSLNADGAGIRIDFSTNAMWQGGEYGYVPDYPTVQPTQAWELMVNENRFHIDRLANTGGQLLNKEYFTILSGDNTQDPNDPYLNGYTGINTSSPDANLSVQGRIGFRLLRDEFGYSGTQLNVGISSNNGPAGARFSMSDNAFSNSVDALFLANNGRVGLGTTNPGTHVEMVDGTFKLSGTSSGFNGSGIEDDARFVIDTDASSSHRFAEFRNSTGEKFVVEGDGTVKAREVLVTLANPFPDYVFEKEYNLLTLSEVKEYINNNGHLPNIPSAEEVAENGMAMAEMQRLMMEKIEELTLYTIELQEQVETLKNKVNTKTSTND